jgi:cell volume regulation protein A
MRRWLGLAALVTALLLTAGGARGATSVPIPGTPIQVVALGPNSVVTTFGTTTNLSWAVINTGSSMLPYRLNVTAKVSDPTLQVIVLPGNVTVPRLSTVQVQVNITVPRSGSPRTVDINVTFRTLSPVVSSVQLNASLIIRSVPATIDVLTAFVAIGLIIAIGFAASLIFDRTRIPDLLILIFLGILLGPIALSYFGIAFVPPAVLEVATPYFAALALMIILFDGGLNLSLLQIIRRLGIVSLHTGVTFVATVFAVAFIATSVLGYPWLVALLLGAILGGTSSAVVIGIVRTLQVSEETKVILTLESVLTDVLCVVLVIALIELLRGGPGASVSIVFTELASRFGVAMLFGVFAGVAWLFLLRRVEKKPFSYMLTIAVLFILYGVTEFSRGSGAMASFVFGLILGNHAELAKRLSIPTTRFVVDDKIKQFHSELSFVIRTFFFVFLGLVFTLQVGGVWAVSSGVPALQVLNGSFSLFLIGVLLIFGMIVLVRIVTAWVITYIRPRPAAERRVLWTLMGRGLAAAVLSSVPFTVPAFTSPVNAGDLYYRSLMGPVQVQFLNATLYIILLTVVATTMGVAASARSLGIPRPRPVSTAPTFGLWSQWDQDMRSLEDRSTPVAGTGEVEDGEGTVREAGDASKSAARPNRPDK